MGDSGSLGLGAMLGMSALVLKAEWPFVLLSGLFIAEAVSVILQVGYFKRTGARLFRMAPIHHHFELCGWHESQVVTRFWLLSVVCLLLGIGGM